MTTTKLLRVGCAAAATTVLLAGCAAQQEHSGGDPQAGLVVPQERCEANRSAGTITYLTGYQFQSSASILEILAAEALGYFDQLCLDVEIEPGNGQTNTNAQLVAADTVQFSAVSHQDLLLFHDNDVTLRGISAYSDAGLEVLMTMPEISELTELDGTVLGHKGSMPTSVLAMLDQAGVDSGSLEQVTVGFDPSVLPRGQVSSLTGFISNEPNQLAAAGTDVTVWRPYDFGVPSSLGALVVNPAFADAYPSATEDFLRGAFRAFDYCAENVAECIEFSGERTGPGFDAAHNANIWRTEVGIVEETAEGRQLGVINPDNVVRINATLKSYDLLQDPLADDEALALFDTGIANSLYDEDGLIWPVS